MDLLAVVGPSSERARSEFQLILCFVSLWESEAVQFDIRDLEVPRLRPCISIETSISSMNFFVFSDWSPVRLSLSGAIPLSFDIMRPSSARTADNQESPGIEMIGCRQSHRSQNHRSI
jgi:hypothetical protein